MSMGMTEMKGDMRVDMMYGHMTGGEMDGHMAGYGGQAAAAGGDQYYNQQWCPPDYNYYQVSRLELSRILFWPDTEYPADYLCQTYRPILYKWESFA